jgi:hypothetical protein
MHHEFPDDIEPNSEAHIDWVVNAVVELLNEASPWARSWRGDLPIMYDETVHFLTMVRINTKIRSLGIHIYRAPGMQARVRKE